MRLAALCSPYFLFVTRLARAMPPEASVSWVRSRCTELLAEIEAQLTDHVDASLYWKDAKLALTALTDQLLNGVEWAGREEWRAQPLSQLVCGVANAGDEIYARIERMEPEADELAEVFFRTLTLGFQGKLRTRPEERRELIRELYAKLPGRIAKASDPLTPDAYAATESKDMTQLPSLTIVQVVIVLIGLIGLSLVATSIVRSTAQQGLSSVIEKIDATDGTVGG